MKIARWWLSLVVAVAGLLVMSWPTAVRAQDDGNKQMAMRLDRLEQQMQQLIERQERMGGGPGAGPQHWQPPPMAPRGPEGAPGMAPQPGMMPPPGMASQCPMGGPGPQAGMACGRMLGCLRAVMFLMFVIHILLAVWVYKDIRRRGEGHGLFVVLALLAGIPAMILYALIRIADGKAPAA